MITLLSNSLDGSGNDVIGKAARMRNIALRVRYNIDKYLISFYVCIRSIVFCFIDKRAKKTKL